MVEVSRVESEVREGKMQSENGEMAKLENRREASIGESSPRSTTSSHRWLATKWVVAKLVDN